MEMSSDDDDTSGDSEQEQGEMMTNNGRHFRGELLEGSAENSNSTNNESSDENDENIQMSQADSTLFSSPTIIFQPGSRNLRFGKFTDSSPMTIFHAIARRRPKPQQKPGSTDSGKDNKDISASSYSDTLYPLDHRLEKHKLPPEFESARLQLCHTVQTALKSDGSDRFATPTQTIATFNKCNNRKTGEASRSSTRSNSWEDFSGQDVVIGDDVLKVDPGGCFNIHFPWRRGQPNVHSGIGGSLSSVMEDLGHIWLNCVTEKLNIPQNEIHNYKAVVIVPVMLQKTYAKELMNVIINVMGFGSAFLIQDHICASFGAGLSCTTVVDVGDQKISVSCVEDGISCPQSRIELKYGGLDLTHAFWNLMIQGAVPFVIDRKSIWDINFLNGLKEKLCHFDLDRCGPEEHKIVFDKPGQKASIKYNLLFGDELLIVPGSFFNPDLLRGSVESNSVIVHKPTTYLSDLFDANYLTETSRKAFKETDGDPDEDEMEDSKEDILQPRKMDSDKLLGIDQAILQSVESSNFNDDTKRRLYSCVLIVGGGFKFPGLGPWLENKLNMTIPKQFNLDCVDVITDPKEMDPSIATWKGASILVTLETASELWISKQEWQEHGFRILRERSLCPF